LFWIGIMSFYQKYRPQTFAQLVNQQQVKDTLRFSLKKKSTSHAYIFAGPRGTGKTTVARILAKALNCEHPKNGEPCDKCLSCSQIKKDASLDLIEIDAASNRGIDEIRELREKVKLAPSISKFKVFIIDEVHMLTIEAFNALLKTLEEPPSHVVFILCTTEPHKVPLTILSRCQRFDFIPLSIVDILAYLKDIARREKIKIEEDALKLIAVEAEGGLRDALSTFEMISASSGKTEITHKFVSSVLGRVGIRILIKFVDGILAEEPELLLKIVERIIAKGYDPENFLDEFIKYLRELLLIKTRELTKEELFSLHNKEEVNKMIFQAKKLSQEKFVYFIEKSLKMKNRLKYFPLSEIGLEVLALELILKHSKDRSFNKDDYLDLKGKDKNRDKNQVEKSSGQKIENEKLVKKNSQKGIVEIENNQWNDFLEIVKRHNHSLRAILSDVLTKRINGNKLEVEVAFPFYKQKIENLRFKKLLEQGAEKCFGKKLKIICFLRKNKKTETRRKNHLLDSVKEVFKL